MLAYIKTTYGGPEILQLKNCNAPVLPDHHVLIKVAANSVNPVDWHILRGKPFFARFTTGLFKPKLKIPGSDFSGTVIKAGKQVSTLKPGDRVFGSMLEGGAFAQHISVPVVNCALMPENADFKNMAALPMAGTTALQALITHGRLKAGEKVLINGAAGGVGHLAVQIASAFGAKVSACCSSESEQFVKQLGAHHIIPYDKENIHKHSGQYDLVIDVNGNLTYSDYLRMGQRGVMVGFTSMKHMLSVLFQKTSGTFPLIQFTSVINTNDLNTLAKLIQNQVIKPYINKTYTYQDIPEAITHIETNRVKGKIVMLWNEEKDIT